MLQVDLEQERNNSSQATKSLYIAEETKDLAATAITVNAATNKWDALGLAVSNVGDPTDPQDLTTKTYVDVSTAASVTNAAASAAAALVSEGNSSTTAAASLASQYAAAASAVEAADFAVDATNNGDAQVALAAAQVGLATAQAVISTDEATASAASAAEALVTISDTNLVTVATDLANGGVSGIADYGSITDPATTVGVGTSYIKLVKDNLVPINNVATNMTAVTTTYANMADINTASANATTATTQAGIAATQAGTATAQAINAATSATAAAGSESLVNSYKVAALAAQASAESARDAAFTAYDNFDDRYLGAKASNPTTDNDGNAILAGAIFWDTTAETMKIYTGSAWVAAYVSGGGFAVAATAIDTGSGLQGGGDISTDRVISIATGGVTATHLSSTIDLGTL